MSDNINWEAIGAMFSDSDENHRSMTPRGVVSVNGNVAVIKCDEDTDDDDMCFRFAYRGKTRPKRPPRRTGILVSVWLEPFHQKGATSKL